MFVKDVVTNKLSPPQERAQAEELLPFAERSHHKYVNVLNQRHRRHQQQQQPTLASVSIHGNVDDIGAEGTASNDVTPGTPRDDTAPHATARGSQRSQRSQGPQSSGGGNRREEGSNERDSSFGQGHGILTAGEGEGVRLGSRASPGVDSIRSFPLHRSVNPSFPFPPSAAHAGGGGEEDLTNSWASTAAESGSKQKACSCCKKCKRKKAVTSSPHNISATETVTTPTPIPPSTEAGSN